MRHSTFLKALAIILLLWGGGFESLSAITLQEICPNPNNCKINDNKHYSEVTNHDTFSMTNNNTIQLSDLQSPQDATIDTFINYGTIISNYKESIKIEQKGYIGNLINYGTITGHIYIGNANSKGAIGTITNYGVMGSIYTSTSAPTAPINITINNLGIIKAHTDNAGSGVNNTSNLNAQTQNITFTLQNYTIKVDEGASDFNNFSGNKSDTTAIKNSHLVIDANNGGSVRFKDGDSKIILDFGNDFEFGAKYLISKIVTDTSGATYSALGVEFDRLTPKSDIYTLYKQGDYFIARLQPQHSIIGNLYKSNVRTMNNFYTLSNSMIYPRKHNLVILREQSDRRISNIVDSAFFAESNIKSNEIFFYRNEAINRRIKRQNKRNYNRKSQNLNLDSANENNPSLRADSQNLRGNPNLDSANRDYYFILTPFINHNFFFESGRYNLRDFDYGFLTAFSARVAESNSLGAHFIISYGSLGDSKDKDLSIKSLNLNLGLNYKLDLIWDMFVKARGDFYYFLNQVKTLTMLEAIKPNNLGFGASVAYGKEWDFKSGGVLGIEAGIDYKALQSSTISLHDNVYQKSLYHLLYADLGVSYSKYFGNFGLNAGLGIKGNITANKLAKSQIHISNLNRNVDMVLDNDTFLGYANLGASYMLNTKSFDMEFSLAYYGNFGDRIISNAGGFEWRVFW